MRRYLLRLLIGDTPVVANVHYTGAIRVDKEAIVINTTRT